MAIVLSNIIFTMITIDILVQEHFPQRKTPSSMSSAVEEEEERSNSGNNNTAAARKFSPGNNNSGNNNAAAGTKYSSGNRNFFNPYEKQRGSRGNPFESVNIWE